MRSYLLTTATVIAFSGASFAATKVGIVGEVNPVLMAESSEGVERELYAGDTVFLNETLKTTESGSAQLMFLDRSALTISPNSKVIIDQFVYDPATELGEMSLNAGLGSLRFVGGALSKKNPVTIKTPVSTMGIRGGIGDVHVGPEGATEGVFHHGDAMTMTNEDGVTEVTTEPGSGFAQPTAKARPTKMTGPKLNNRLKNPPTRMAANVGTPASPQRLQQLNQQVRVTNPSPVAPASPAPAPPAAQPQVQPETPPAATPPVAETPPTDAPAQPPTETPPATTAPEPAAQDAPAPQVEPDAQTSFTDDPLSETEVNEIRTNPKSVLDKFPKGGPKMASYVTRAVATDPSLAQSMGNLDGATRAQASAVGAGVVRAGRLIAAQDPEALQRLNDDVEKMSNPHVKRMFKAIGPQVPQIGGQDIPSRLPQVTAPSRTLGSDLNNEARKMLRRQVDNRRFPRVIGPNTPRRSSLNPSQNSGVLNEPAAASAVTTFAASENVENDTRRPSVKPSVKPSVVVPVNDLNVPAQAPDVPTFVESEPEDNDAGPVSPTS
jgi:hypothetical protein